MSEGKLKLQVFICGKPFLSVFAGLLPFSPAVNINYFADGSNWPSICVQPFPGPKVFAVSEDTNEVLTLSFYREESHVSPSKFWVLGPTVPFAFKVPTSCLNLYTIWSQSCLFNTILPMTATRLLVAPWICFSTFSCLMCLHAIVSLTWSFLLIFFPVHILSWTCPGALLSFWKDPDHPSGN